MVNCCGPNKWCFIKPFHDANGKLDINRAVEAFKEHREEIRLLTKADKHTFLSSLVTSAITEDVQNCNGKRRLHYEWKLGSNIVCLATMTKVYQFTNWKMKKIVTGIKQQENTDIKSYTDSTLHNYTYSDTMKVMFKNNLEFSKFV
jgi:hypothetical protein